MMLQPGPLILLLAVFSQQLHSATSVTYNISECPINLYGKTFSKINVGQTGYQEICFGEAVSSSSGDCLLLLKTEDIDVSVDINGTSLRPGSAVHQALPDIVSASSCHVKFSIKDKYGDQYDILIYNFGGLSVLEVDIHADSNITVRIKVAARILKRTFEPDKENIMDIRGCRYSSSVLFLNASESNSADCMTVTCNASAHLTATTNCRPTEFCESYVGCLPTNPVCTVTGSTVITFKKEVKQIPDRCVYTLMMGYTFNLLAGFKERRRKDVTFLDYLKIQMVSEDIYLEQGGRVLVNGLPVMLNATGQLIHGLTLSKDSAGVTVEFPPPDNLTIFFDGYTAHIRVNASAADVRGLCGFSRIDEAKAFFASPYGCEMPYIDSNTSAINCNLSTEHCSMIRQEPFTACHSYIDPGPYITACTNTLCYYPSVDSLKCQFVEAYAKACRMEHHITVMGWRESAQCSPKAFCQDRYCSSHEFCGEVYVGHTRCFCRAIFASKYRETDTLGEPTVCMEKSATVTMFGCLMADRNMDYSVLHLNDENCKGHMDPETHMVTFSFNETNICGTEIVENNTQIIYRNTIMTRNSSMYGIVTRHDQVELDFSCYYEKPKLQTMSFKIKDSSVMQQIVSGMWNYTLSMNAYSDPHHMNLIEPNTEVMLNQKVWMELATEGLKDQRVSLLTDSCWATREPSPNSTLRYNLIEDGCPNPADNTVKVENNGNGTSNYFSFNMFEFSGHSDDTDIYLHCKLELCIIRGGSCVPNCNKGIMRRRRYANSHKNTVFISMTWTK